MSEHYLDKIKEFTQADGFSFVETIQTLWSGYGDIKRYHLINGLTSSVVVKHVRLPKNIGKAKVSEISHNRKIQSYKVEINWYKDWNKRCNSICKTPFCYGIELIGDEVLIVLEDLNSSGFPLRFHSVSLKQMEVCLEWLANFHATYMGYEPIGLWDTGTYWHLDTRPEEFNALDDISLKKGAQKIDQLLKQTPYQTFVHGDAKLANFCFSDSNSVAVVDFQYVGKGCGMKDVAYFIGSCLDEKESELNELFLLDSYFKSLIKALELRDSKFDLDDLERSWREMFPIAWTDFHRFYKGWSHGYWSSDCYSERLSQAVLKRYL